MTSVDVAAERIEEARAHKRRAPRGLALRLDPQVMTYLGMALANLVISGAGTGMYSSVEGAGTRLARITTMALIVIVPIIAIVIARSAQDAALLAESDRLRATSNYFRSFVGHVSHETRVPLQSALLAMEECDGVLGGAEWTAESRAKLREGFVLVSTSVSKAETVLGEALELQRSEVCGRDAVHGRWLSIGSMAVVAKDLGRRLAKGKVRLSCANLAAGKKLWGFLDLGAWTRICKVLLSNAIRFHQGPRPVELRVTLIDRPGVQAGLQERDTIWPIDTPRVGWELNAAAGKVEELRVLGLCVEVADQGPGIEEGDREKLFRPFLRMVSGEAIKGVSTGIGLAMSQALARTMGGSLGHQARPDGTTGSVFSFQLPVLMATVEHGDAMIVTTIREEEDEDVVVVVGGGDAVEEPVDDAAIASAAGTAEVGSDPEEALASGEVHLGMHSERRSGRKSRQEREERRRQRQKATTEGCRGDERGRCHHCAARGGRCCHEDDDRESTEEARSERPSRGGWSRWAGSAPKARREAPGSRPTSMPKRCRARSAGQGHACEWIHVPRGAAGLSRVHRPRRASHVDSLRGWMHCPRSVVHSARLQGARCC
jgi:signal transduction histidine kinase